MILIAGAAHGRVNGLIVVFSRVPDVVARSRPASSGAASRFSSSRSRAAARRPEFLNLGAGTTFTPWLPNALILLAVAVAVIWMPVRRVRARACALRHRQRPHRRLPQRRQRRAHALPAYVFSAACSARSAASA